MMKCCSNTFFDCLVVAFSLWYMIIWVGKIHICIPLIFDRINQGLLFSITNGSVGHRNHLCCNVSYQSSELIDTLLQFLTVVVLNFAIIHSCQCLLKMIVCSQTLCPYTIQAVNVWSIVHVVSSLHQLPKSLVFFLLSFLSMLRLLDHKSSLLYPHQQQ